ncbi:DUF2782 domain-containing protein [Balneatrix alpica]|uniref:DUF2782 domain-containing protein n=1 Tax=Balneatrix alpica TaxID=75684 RepID=A0ABV5ZAW7_9GAMM|nr:DUF2782 domain-containing protein [Balneatrix alpica]
MRTLLFAALLACSSVVAVADEAIDEPKIVISHSEDKTFYEYRVNGEVVEIKVVPKEGKPYYLVPLQGKGLVRRDESSLRIPKWVIFQW